MMWLGRLVDVIRVINDNNEKSREKMKINSDLQTKINESYDTLKLAAEMSKLYYQEPLIITYSGGKDSDVLLNLALECLNNDDFEVVNSHTTVDAPPTVYHIRNVFKKLEQQGIKTKIIKPKHTMWELIEMKLIPPTRIIRYCCSELKETSTPNRLIATGVREDESTGRRGRDAFSVRGKTKKDMKYFSLQHTHDVFADSEAERKRMNKGPNDWDVTDCTLIENAKKKNDLVVNPIYKWTHSDIWTFIRARKIKYCELYDMGYSRVGCVGCPLSSYNNRVKEFNDFPKYKENYIRAFQRMVDRREKLGKLDEDKRSITWKDGKSVFDWWIEEPIPDEQISFDDLYKEEERCGWQDLQKVSKR